MKQRSSIMSKSIATKLMLVNTLICAVFILIAVVTFLSFQHIEDVLTQNVTKEIDGAIENAQAGRELGRIVSGSTLLESTFFGKDDLLEAQGKRLIKKITSLEARTADPRLKESMVGYRRKLQRVLEQCTTVNGLYHEIQSIQGQLATSLTALEEIIANKMIAQVLQGEDISIIEQLAVIVAGYRETLLQINIRFAELGLAYFESPMTKQENPMFPVMDYLFLRLRPLSATEPEIAEYGLLIMADVMKYKEAVSRFHQVAGELRKRLDEVYLEKEGILFLMEEMDKRFATTTEHMSGNITAIISKSGKFLIILSGSVIILLGILPFFFVVSNIRKPMRAILTGIEAIGSGYLNTKIRLGRRDEWSIIEKALNNMASARKQAENKLIESEAQLRQIIDLVPHFIFVKDETGKFEIVNKATAEVFGTTVEDLTGRRDSEFVATEEEMEHFRSDDLEVIRSGKTKFIPEEPITDSENNLRYLQTTKVPFNFSATKKPSLLGVAVDITRRVRAEEILALEKRRIAYILQGTNVGTWEWNVQTGETTFNERWAEIIGCTLEEISPVSIDTWMKFTHPDDLKVSGELLEKHFNGELDYYEYEARMRHKNGDWVWVLDRGKVATWTEDGKPLLMSGTHSDITDRKQDEKQIAASLKEKEVLLREIHHRTKNNMQVMISLLRIQSENIENKQFAGMLKESWDRIKSMALVHEKLYQSKGLADVDFKGYVKSLVSSIFSSYGANAAGITPITETDDVSIGLETAIPCGLIINELVSNSLKYAFPGNEKGEISVALRSFDEGEVVLEVGDNGIGMPEDLDFRNTASMGLHLVHILSEGQLHGKIELDRAGGTTFRIRFKNHKYEARI